MKMQRTTKKRDKTGDEMEPEMSREKEEPQVMRLKMEDCRIFGLCPARDEFYLVVCEQCGQVVKPQALQRHIEFRHGKPPDGPLPPLPIPAPLGDTPSPPCNKQIMHALRKTDRSLGRSPSRSNSHQLIVSYPQVAESPSPEAADQHAQSVPDIIAAAAKSALDINPLRQLAEHLRLPLSTSPPSPHDPHLLLRSPPSSVSVSNRVPSVPVSPLLSVPPSPVDTVLLDSPLLGAVRVLSSQRTSELSQELSIQVHSQDDELLVNRTLPSVERNYTGDTVEVVLASPPVQTMPVPLSAAETLSPSLSMVNLEALGSSDTPSLVCISRGGGSTTTAYPPVQPRPLAPITPTPTPTPPPAPSLTPTPSTPPKATSKKKKANTVKSDKNVPCKDRCYDPNKHCGVWNEDDKRHCTRSLTCKTHSLSLRRAVQGRRLPFNELLAEHKARSQALAAAKAAAAAGNTTTASAAGSTATNPLGTPTAASLSNNVSGATQLTLSQAGMASLMPVGQEILNPQKLGGTPTVPVVPNPGPTPIIINSSPHPLKRPLSVTTQSSSSLHLNRDDPSPSPMVVVSGDLPSTPSQLSTAPLRRQEHHPSPTHQRVPPQGGGARDPGERIDSPCTHHHPRPSAMCTYGSKRTERGMVVINRRQDRLRAVLAGLVERQLKPPPLKKACYSQESPVVPNLAKPGSHVTSVPPKLTNSHLDAALLAPHPKGSTSKSSSSKSKKSKASKAEKAGESTVLQHVKNAKVRRKSGSGGASGGISPAIIQSSSASNIMHNIFAVSSSSNMPLALAPTTYTVVGGNGLQPVDVINVDPSTSVEMQGQLLKNLRFVVTNIETNANNATSGAVGAASQAAVANMTLPIINAVGSAPMVIGNIGALQLHDGKMNIKSRTKGVGNKTLERQTSRSRKPSGSGIAHCTSHPTVQIGTVQGDTIIVQEQGVIPSMRSSPSPVLRPESSSPQLTSIPNGIIPSPSATATLYGGTKLFSSGPVGAAAAMVGVGGGGGVVVVDQHPLPQQHHTHHQQQHQPSHQQQQQQQQLHTGQLGGEMTSQSGTSTPSPGGNSTETSPSGGFQYTSGIQSHSANKILSSSNSSKASGGSSGRKQPLQANTKPSGVLSTGQAQPTALQQIPFPVPLQLQQHIMANLIDAQGKPLSALIPANHQLFSNIQLQPGAGGANTAAAQATPIMQGAVATVTPGDKATSPPTAAAASILAQQPIALSLQQATQHHHHQAGNQPIRLQQAGLAGVAEHTSQVVLSPGGAGDARQELKLHH